MEDGRPRPSSHPPHQNIGFSSDPVAPSSPEMDDSSSHDRKKKYFLWGTVLTWTLSIPLIVWMFNSFGGIQQEKATGLAAAAGGIAEMYATFGLILAFVLPVGAIVLLVGSFSRGHRIRTLFSVLYIGWSAFTLVAAGLFVWFLVHMHHVAAAPR